MQSNINISEQILYAQKKMGPRVLQKYFLKHINMKHKTVKLELTYRHIWFSVFTI